MPQLNVAASLIAAASVSGRYSELLSMRRAIYTNAIYSLLISTTYNCFAKKRRLNYDSDAAAFASCTILYMLALPAEFF